MATRHQVFEGLRILAENGSDEKVEGGLEVIFAEGAPPEKMRKADVTRLKRLGWNWSHHFQCWILFT